MIQLVAIEALAGMVDATAVPALSSPDLEACLNLSVIPDSAGTPPNTTGWTPTWDLDWAAAETCVLRHLRSQTLQAADKVTLIESEGSRFQIKPGSTDWLDAARTWRQRSKLGRQLGYGQPTGLLQIEVPTVLQPGTDIFR